MTTGEPYLAHLSSSKDLVTTYEATRAGFVKAVLEKNRRASPFVDEARTLRVKATRARAPQGLLDLPEIGAGLLAASGVSDKAANHLKPEDRVVIVREFIRNFLEPAGEKFVEELVYRFLLIRGDALGGKIRNLAGIWAQSHLTRSILSDLFIAGRDYRWLDSATRKWLSGSDEGDKEGAKALSWRAKDQDRVLVYNLQVPFIEKNVDLCLLDCSLTDLARRKEAQQIYSSPEHYIALGELKGGIDPAGADEHWKTANSALSRIRDAFAKRDLAPDLFFVGAAIQDSMAQEIWDLLEDGQLANAANLNSEEQLVSIASWLCGL
jgi:hypothetical protein